MKHQFKNIIDGKPTDFCGGYTSRVYLIVRGKRQSTGLFYCFGCKSFLRKLDRTDHRFVNFEDVCKLPIGASLCFDQCNTNED